MAMTRSKIADIKQQLNKPLVKGEKWYLVDRKWFDQWKKYVNLDGQDESDTQEIYNPGPFDNSSILGKSGNLKPKLSEKEDYEVVPESVWNYFNQTFGRMPKQEPISRQVIDVGKDKEWLQLEIYPIEVELEHINNKNKQLPVTREFSRIPLKKRHEWYKVWTKDFEESTKAVCKSRDDDWSNNVFRRICAVSNLHAVDAIYHAACSSMFRLNKSLPARFATQELFGILEDTEPD
ncbi:ubiquitin carboxyl-terminal hydrolase 15-like [Artemia franciscana]|uniref:ubiquitin carboxyl-terminal hydrolase 15-like n=1 Tax=Artemia franciscana TaxID=6661 RepID=UPI0032DB296D